MRIITMAMIALLLAVAGCSGGGQDEAAVQGADAQTAGTSDLVPASAGRQDVGHHVDRCRTAVQKLGGALKTELQAAMKEGGPMNALNVCHDEAQVIADRICDEEGLTVGRTSRKFRNPGNAPDAWELAGLEAFDARIAEGENVKDLEMWETVSGKDGTLTFRYLKAIPTAPLCLKCHGAELEADLDAKLVELYPDDHARGFATGDMRGAFSVKMDLPTTPLSGG